MKTKVKVNLKYQYILIMLICIFITILLPKQVQATGKTLLHIDYPIINSTQNTSMYVEGWVMSEEKNVQIHIYINGKEYTETIERTERKDVLNAIKGYGDTVTNKTPGFEGKIDLREIKDGTYKISIVATDSSNKNVLAKEERNITIAKYKTILNVDYPKINNTVTSKVYVEGWSMSELAESDRKTRIYVDNKEYTDEIKMVERKDVLNAIKGYGNADTNKTPGFEGTIDISKLSFGKHTIKTEIYDISTEETLAQDIREFTIRPYNNLLCVDYPRTNTTQNTSMYVEGWFMADTSETKIEIEINSKDYTNQLKRVERPDVIKAIKGYGTQAENPTPGFVGTIDLSNLQDGTYTVTIKAISTENQNVITQESKTIYLRKYNTLLNVDYPKINQDVKNNLYIEGWAMSTATNKTLEVYLDGTNITNKVQIVERPDVIKAIKGYGTQTENPTPGFIANVDVSQIKGQQANHNLKIRIISNDAKEILAEQNISIGINRIPYEEGYYGYSGLAALGNKNGSDLKYYKIGNGPNVFFATFSVHGFEDLWSYDGQELTNIANEFRDHLLRIQDQELASKWTIYLFPQVNPDGAKHGSTNNGPGRTTLYSWAPGNKGIDINRSWQVGSHYTRYTDNRNYNGTEGFQAYEIRFLRDFLYSNRSKNGQTVLVDLHGWTQQLIGDPGICSYYQKQFPENSTKTVGMYGDGYLVNWARNSLGSSKGAARAALIELPNQGIYGHQSVIQNGLPTRYINATLSMLRNIV